MKTFPTPEKHASPEELCLQSVLFLLSEPPPSTFATQDKASADGVVSESGTDSTPINVSSSRLPGVSFSNETETSGTAESGATPSIISLPSGLSTVPPSRSMTSRSETDREHSVDLFVPSSVQDRPLNSRLQDKKDSSSEPGPKRDTDISLGEREAYSEPGKLPGQSSDGKAGANTSPKKSLPKFRERKSNEVPDSRTLLKNSREITKSKVSIASSAGFSLQAIPPGSLPIGEFTDVTDKNILPLISHSTLGDSETRKGSTKKQEDPQDSKSYEDSEFSATEVRPGSVKDRISVMTNQSLATNTRQAPSPNGSLKGCLLSRVMRPKEQSSRKEKEVEKTSSGTSLRKKPSPAEMLFTVAPFAEGIVHHGGTPHLPSAEKPQLDSPSQGKEPKKTTDKDTGEVQPQNSSEKSLRREALFQRPATAPDGNGNSTTRPLSSFRSVQSDIGSKNSSKDLPRRETNRSGFHPGSYFGVHQEKEQREMSDESSYGRSDDDDFYHQDLNGRPVPQLIHDVPPQFSDTNGHMSDRSSEGGRQNSKNAAVSNAGAEPLPPNPSTSPASSATSRTSVHRIHRTPELSSYAENRHQKRAEGGQSRFGTSALDSHRSSVNSLPRSTISFPDRQAPPSTERAEERPRSEQDHRSNEQKKLYAHHEAAYRDPRSMPINESSSAEAFNNESAMSWATVSSSHLQNQYQYTSRPPPPRFSAASPSASYYPTQAPKQYQEYPHHAFPDNNHYKYQDSHHRHEEHEKHSMYMPEHEAYITPGFESDYDRQVRFAQMGHNRHSPRVHYFETQAGYPVPYGHRMQSGNTPQRDSWEGSSVDLPPNADYPVPQSYREHFAFQQLNRYPAEGPQTSRASFSNRKISGTTVETDNDGATTELERRRGVSLPPEVIYLPPPPKETKDATTSTPRTRLRSKTSLSAEESSVTSGDSFKARSISKASRISDSVKSAVATVFLPIQRSVSDHFLTSDRAVRSAVEKTYRRGVRVAKFFSNLESPLTRARETLKLLLSAIFNLVLRHKWIPLLIVAYFLRPTIESAAPSVVSYLNSWRGSVRNTALPPVVPSSPSDPVPFSPRDLFSHWVMGGKFRSDLRTRPVATPVLEPHTVPPAPRPAPAPYKAPPGPAMTIDSVACVDSSGPREILSEWAMGSLLRSGSKKLCADAVRASQAQRARLQGSQPSSECSAFDPVCIFNSLINSRLNPFQTVA
ncbi:hypothetical protein RvY_00834-2 [Ramazzottius varieornatus]|uniref:Uncharacterized protein n=1 Tax=Ramazzottius varieornatus TaxID=947166 RepID=A0A1D1UF27_RAMVA|nr:hypothetical protein RvY_00834-2 [Ramazzottius varieornatus]